MTLTHIVIELCITQLITIGILFFLTRKLHGTYEWNAITTDLVRQLLHEIHPELDDEDQEDTDQ